MWRKRVAMFPAVALALAGASLAAATNGGPSLGAARSFGVLGGSAVTSTGATTVTGDVGVSPGTSVTGFPPGVVTGGTIHAGDALAAQAHADAVLAYEFLAGLPSLTANNLSDLDLGGRTLLPGVYRFNGSAQLTGALTLDAQGDSEALFVFQIGSTLTTASDATVTVVNGGVDFDESGVYWQVGSSATLGTGTAFTGHVLALSSVTLVSGTSLTGNALALNGAVTLGASSVVTSPALSDPPTPLPGAPVAPSDLTATSIGGDDCVGTDLVWVDRSDDESQFRIYRRDGAGPEFLLVGSVSTSDGPGTGGLVTHRDPRVGATTPATYRVTAINLAALESVPSNEIRLEACVVVPTPTRWLDVDVGRGRNVLMDRTRPRSDTVLIRGSYTVIDMTSSGPVVLRDADPRVAAVSIQVTAPGNLLLVTIPANDPRWRVSKQGIYRWTGPRSRTGPNSVVTFDTRKSEFTLRSRRVEFDTVPVNSVTVSLTCLGATGTDVRAWVLPVRQPAGTRTFLALPK